MVQDKYADVEEVHNAYGIKIQNDIDEKFDVILIAVNHDYMSEITIPELKKMYKTNKMILFDIKRVFDKRKIEDNDIKYWSL